MAGNFPPGFLGWQARIDAISEALGGSAVVREWVATEFAEKLRATMAIARGVRDYDLPWRVAWTMATTAEFDQASAERERVMGIEQYEPIAAEVEWNGAMIRRREAGVWLEGGGYRLLIGLASVDRDDSHPRGGNWRTHMCDEAMSASGQRYGPGKHSSVNSKSRAAAIRSLDKLVESFFGVQLKPVGQ